MITIFCIFFHKKQCQVDKEFDVRCLNMISTFKKYYGVSRKFVYANRLTNIKFKEIFPNEVTL